MSTEETYKPFANVAVDVLQKLRTYENLQADFLPENARSLIKEIRNKEIVYVQRGGMIKTEVLPVDAFEPPRHIIGMHLQGEVDEIIVDDEISAQILENLLTSIEQASVAVQEVLGKEPNICIFGSPEIESYIEDNRQHIMVSLDIAIAGIK